MHSSTYKIYYEFIILQNILLLKGNTTFPSSILFFYFYYINSAVIDTNSSVYETRAWTSLTLKTSTQSFHFTFFPHKLTPQTQSTRVVDAIQRRGLPLVHAVAGTAIVSRGTHARQHRNGSLRVCRLFDGTRTVGRHVSL